MPHLRLSVSLLLLSSLVAPASAQGHPFRFAREDVLGTSAELMVDASDEATAQRAEALLDELRPESPLRHRLSSELAEICRMKQVTVS